MKSIIPQHDQGASSLWGAAPEKMGAEMADRGARLKALDPEQLPLALSFLIGYHPRAFDAALAAVAPRPARGGADGTPEQEPFCMRCDAPVGIFLAHGKEYMHYCGVVTETSKPRPYKADHKPVIGWRPASDVFALAG